MNYYDLSNTFIPATKGYKKGLFQKKAAITYRITICLCGILTIFLILFSIQRTDYSSSMLKYCLLIFVTVVVFSIMMYASAIIISYKKTEKLSIADKHDYNLALYRNKYKNSRRLQSFLLIQMAMQQLILGNFNMSLQALSLVSVDHLNITMLRNYYLYKAVALYMDGVTDWEVCLNSCYAIPVQRNQLSNEEISSAFPSDIIQPIKNSNQRTRNWPIALILSALVILYAGFYYGLEGLLFSNYNYRYWFEMSSIIFISIAAILLSLYWIIKFILFRNNITGKNSFFTILKNILMGIVWFCLTAMLLLYQFITFMTVDKELEVYKNGLICLVTEIGYDSNEYYYNMKVGPFLRRSLSNEEFKEYKLDSNYSNNNSTDNDYNQGNDSTDSESESNDINKPDDITLFRESQAVYQYLAAEGQMTDADITQLEHGFTAKGNFYTVFESGESDGNAYENRLVYDRTSANGKCELFVYQQVKNGSDTVILGFYAVNIESNQVISAGKTTWGGSSSSEYKEATGED